MKFLFADHTLDTDRRELCCSGAPVPVEPQVFDLLTYLVQNRERVVSKDDLFASVWRGRIVSDSTFASCISAARRAVGDSGEEQKLIRTVARKGIRFVGTVDCQSNGEKPVDAAGPRRDEFQEPIRPSLPPFDRPAIAVLPFVNMSGDAVTETREPAPLGDTEDLPPLPDKPSIAVLSFKNMSGDPEQEYFADGMAEDITTALSRFKSLFVIARNSSFSYKGKAIDVKRVGGELGVRYVLEGSVRRAGSRVRIAAQLIDAASGAHIWADRFDGALEDVFEFQDQVTERVVGAIAPRVERAEMVRAWRRPPSNTDAYDCYLRGLACLSPMTADGLEQALGLFTKASALDPDYASAYGMAMHCHAHRFDLLLAEADDIAHRRSEISRLWPIVARVGQDDGVALGEAAWAVAYLLRDLSSARQLIDRALELNPNLGSAWANSGWINVWQGHPDLAIEHLDRAERLDPGSLRLTSFVAMAHARFFLGEYEKALGLAEGMLRHSPDAHVCLRIGAASAAIAGRIDTAHRLAARLQVIDPAFGVSRLREYLGPYQKSAFVEKYAEGLRLAGLPE